MGVINLHLWSRTLQLIGHICSAAAEREREIERKEERMKHIGFLLNFLLFKLTHTHKQANRQIQTDRDTHTHTHTHTHAQAHTHRPGPYLGWV